MRILCYVSFGVKQWTLPDRAVNALRARFPDITFVHAHTPEEALAGIVDADAALSSRLTPEMVAAAPKLRWVHSTAVNVLGLLPIAELAARGIQVSNSRGIQGVPIAETVMGGLLVLGRRFDRMLAAQRQHAWIQNALFDELPTVQRGKRMAIIGLGDIGLAIAQRAHAFEMTVVGVRRNPAQPTPSCVSQVYGPDQLHDAITGADVLVLAAPSGSATERLIGARELALLNPGAVVVNVARASIVDEPALLSALRSGAVGGAVLDVFLEEPLAPDHPYWDMANVILTPHVSGFNAQHWDLITALYVENLQRYLADEPLRYPVDLTAGY
ncbi:MAG: D-2-hydroxyacid dehydrogenase [Gemmatimonadaceae bacterium]|nr:D-2-hydroxyacid dehydrogenase [Gemmatimonadaceae bacterium]